MFDSQTSGDYLAKSSKWEKSMFDLPKFSKSLFRRTLGLTLLYRNCYWIQDHQASICSEIAEITTRWFSSGKKYLLQGHWGLSKFEESPDRAKRSLNNEKFSLVRELRIDHLESSWCNPSTCREMKKSHYRWGRIIPTFNLIASNFKWSLNYTFFWDFILPRVKIKLVSN